MQSIEAYRLKIGNGRVLEDRLHVTGTGLSMR